MNLTQCLRLKLARLRGVHSVYLNYAIEDETDMLKSGNFIIGACGLHISKIAQLNTYSYIVNVTSITENVVVI